MLGRLIQVPYAGNGLLCDAYADEDEDYYDYAKEGRGGNNKRERQAAAPRGTATTVLYEYNVHTHTVQYYELIRAYEKSKREEGMEWNGKEAQRSATHRVAVAVHIRREPQSHTDGGSEAQVNFDSFAASARIWLGSGQDRSEAPLCAGGCRARSSCAARLCASESATPS